jgi:hypothetical protein
MPGTDTSSTSGIVFGVAVSSTKIVANNAKIDVLRLLQRHQKFLRAEN